MGPKEYRNTRKNGKLSCKHLKCKVAPQLNTAQPLSPEGGTTEGDLASWKSYWDIKLELAKSMEVLAFLMNA